MISWLSGQRRLKTNNASFTREFLAELVPIRSWGMVSRSFFWVDCGTVSAERALSWTWTTLAPLFCSCRLQYSMSLSGCVQVTSRLQAGTKEKSLYNDESRLAVSWSLAGTLQVVTRRWLVSCSPRREQCANARILTLRGVIPWHPLKKIFT